MKYYIRSSVGFLNIEVNCFIFYQFLSQVEQLYPEDISFRFYVYGSERKKEYCCKGKIIAFSVEDQVDKVVSVGNEIKSVDDSDLPFD